jgi:rare lipoprotein A
MISAPLAARAQPLDTTYTARGMASYYGDELAGRPTASGEPFDPTQLTAAHRTLPLGTQLRVTHLRNGRSFIVRVNDRGPFTHRRIIDLSYAAARRLDMIETGIARVRLELLR